MTSARTWPPTARASSAHPKRRWRAAGDRRGRDRRRRDGRDDAAEAHGLTGTDEAGSGGDD